MFRPLFVRGILSLSLKKLILANNGTFSNGGESGTSSNISEIKQSIARYNDAQMVLNEDQFGPLLNDSVIVVVQVIIISLTNQSKLYK